MDYPTQAPNPAVRRLSLYLRQLEQLEADRIETVSSHKLAQPLGLTDTQVRKDLAYFGQFGRPGVGYEVKPLIRHLRGIFGTDRLSQVLLVGAGNLGRAVSTYHGLRDKGFEVVAVFDSDPAKIGQRVSHLLVQPLADLTRVASRCDARLAIIAVPAAQEAADQLIAAGVRGIFNLAPTRLHPSPGVIVRNLDVAAELEQLNFLVNMEAPEIPDQKEVLIVDDSEASVIFLSEIVEDVGHRYRVARNGDEASVALKENRPDLVLLDIMMPRKSGITVFQEMKKDPVLKEVPVIMVTGAREATGVDILTGQEAGKPAGGDVARRFGVVLHEMLKGLMPDGLVEKPIDPMLLSEKIRELLP